MALQMLVTAAAAVVAAYVISKLYSHRVVTNKHIPQHPRSFLFGHVVLFGKRTAQGKPDRHPDYIVQDLFKELGNPSVMAVDNWPIVPPLVYIRSHDIAEQVTRTSTQFPYSTPKANSIERLSHLLGENSILQMEGMEWKRVRKLYNAGFSPQYLLTLLPVILDKAKIYISHLERLATTGEPFSMEDYTTNLTFDIIGVVTMGEDMNAQHEDPANGGSLIAATKELGMTYANDRLLLPWYLIPRTHYTRRKLGNQVRRELREIIQRHFDETKQAGQKPKSRSILDLSLQDEDVLTTEFLNETSDQLKTFLFAGHDTTSMAISFAAYELARTPHALQAMRDELDELFGADVAKDPAKLCEALVGPGGKDKVSQMTYIAAVVKETMRLWPPAATTRMNLSAGANLTVTTPEGEFNLDGDWVHLSHYLIHRDPAVYGETANNFVPERWLKGGSAADLPASAWRVFERGPRNCIGQELANIEAKVILALLAYPFTFEKVGLGETDWDADGKPMLDKCGQFKTKSDMYLTMRLLPKPADQMMMKVHRN